MYYEKLRERLEKIIQEEQQRRKESASYFDKYKEILEDALNEKEEREKLGFTTKFEFAAFGELSEANPDKNTNIATAKKVYQQVKPESELIGWKTRTSSDKKISVAIYDTLMENGYPEKKMDELVS